MLEEAKFIVELIEEIERRERRKKILILIVFIITFPLLLYFLL